MFTMLDEIAMRAVTRSLSVLRCMNSYTGPHTISELQSRTGISRPALYRILEALCSLGYVRLADHSPGYQLTHLVRSLSIGFDEEHWVADIASPIIQSLQRQIIWPTDLATYWNGAMYLRETTRQNSPWTIDRASIGLKLPILGSATGRAYLAFCPPRERAAITSILCHPDTASNKAENPRDIEQIVNHTLSVGYGERHGGLIQETGSIAIPIYDNGRVRGCINITFIASLLTPAQAAAKYLGDLKKAGAEITKNLNLMQLEDGPL